MSSAREKIGGIAEKIDSTAVQAREASSGPVKRMEESFRNKSNHNLSTDMLGERCVGGPRWAPDAFPSRRATSPRIRGWGGRIAARTIEMGTKRALHTSGTRAVTVIPPGGGPRARREKASVAQQRRIRADAS